MKISKNLIASVILLASVETAFAQFDLSKIGGVLKNIQTEIDKSKTSQAPDNSTAESALPSVPASISVSQKNSNEANTTSVINTENKTEDSSLDKELNFNQLCEKFKSIDAFSKLASVLKRTDEDLGLPGYLSYADSFPSELSWNPKALVSFTLNKLEILYNKKPFAVDDFEVNLAKSVSSCIAEHLTRHSASWPTSSSLTGYRLLGHLRFGASDWLARLS